MTPEQTPEVYDAEDLTRIRVDEVQSGDLLAFGREQRLGGYTAIRIGLAGPAGWRADWQEPVWRFELDNGWTCTQPGRYPVLIVKREL